MKRNDFFFPINHTQRSTNQINKMKTNITKPSTAALTAAFLISGPIAQAAIITNGNLNTAPSQIGSVAGNSEFTLNTTSLNVLENGSNTGVSANQWVWSSLSRGLTYDAAGGDTGAGGAFIQNDVGDPFNQRARAVAQFANDGGVTLGSQTIRMDVFMDDNSAANALAFIVELYAWDAGETGPGLSLGGPAGPGQNGSSYNVFEPNDAATILNTTVLASGVADATWDTVDLGTVDLGTGGYDFYAWRIGVMGATDGDGFAFDNVAVVPEPSSALMAGLFGACSLLVRRRRNA